MKDYLTDICTGDIVFDGRDISLAEDRRSFQQRVRAAIHLQRGEWFRDTTLGVRYREMILSQPYSSSRFSDELKTAISRLDGFDRFAAFRLEFDRTTRGMGIYAEVVSIYDGNVAIFNETLR